MNKPQVIFFQVKDNALKLKKICELAQLHFEKKERFLFVAPDQGALEFIDNLLWRLPIESFLPHIVSDESNESICITKSSNNVTRANFVFNLCPSALLWQEHIKIIYELEDHTSEEKKQLSEKRYLSYKAAGYPLALSN